MNQRKWWSIDKIWGIQYVEHIEKFTQYDRVVVRPYRAALNYVIITQNVRVT